jgi:hypothetical protein
VDKNTPLSVEPANTVLPETANEEIVVLGA